MIKNIKLPVIDIEGKETGKHDFAVLQQKLDDKMRHNWYLTIKYQNAYGRIGKSSVKTRSAVSGGGAKPYRQKGTGRARRGTSRSPLIRGGGVIFGPVCRDYTIKLNKKVINKVIKSVLSEKVSDVVVLSSVQDELIRTKQMNTLFIEKLNLNGNNDRIAFVIDASQENLWRAARNIKNCDILNVTFPFIEKLLGASKVVITAEALKKLESRILK